MQVQEFHHTRGVFGTKSGSKNSHPPQEGGKKESSSFYQQKISDLQVWIERSQGQYKMEIYNGRSGKTVPNNSTRDT